MAGYLVLARKYRSATFDEVVGQEPIAQTLTSAIRSSRIAHAYLFTGTRGVGKTTMARILAKALNCLSTDEPTEKPCNKCDACISISRGEDMDVIEIDGASNRGIDEIRELRANAIFRPARCRYKIYYIDEVHMLTREAFNALLKTLEEPPEHVKFIFSTTEVEKVPATVVSRCQRFDFRNIPTRLICDHLASICKAEKVKVDQDALFRIARAGAGSMRDGLSLLDQLLAAGGETVHDEDVIRILGIPADERTLSIVRAIADGSTANALGELSIVLSSGVTLASAAGALSDTFRNMMIAATCRPDSDLIELPDTQRQAVAELAGRFSTPALVHAVGICQWLGRSLRTATAGRALLEAGIVRLAEAEKFVDPASLIERLETLGGSGARPAQKKKITPATGNSQTPPVRTTGPDASGGAEHVVPAANLAPIQWESDWLTANWQIVIEHLTTNRQMQIAGTLRPAKVLGFADGILKLGYDSGHDAIRRRCAGPLGNAICRSLAKLAGQEVRCRYMATGAPAAAGTRSAAANHLSTAEKNALLKDQAVRGVLDLFGGDLVDIRRNAPQAGQVESDGIHQQ